MMALGLYLSVFIQLCDGIIPKESLKNGRHAAGSEEACVDDGLKRKKRGGDLQIQLRKEEYPNGFQMPLHYPRYQKEDYQNMEEWKLDILLREYGLGFNGALDEKRAFAMATFLWPDHM